MACAAVGTSRLLLRGWTPQPWCPAMLRQGGGGWGWQQGVRAQADLQHSLSSSCRTRNSYMYCQASALRTAAAGVWLYNRATQQLERERIAPVLLLALRGMYQGPVGRLAVASGLLGPLLSALSRRRGRYMDTAQSVKDIEPFARAFEGEIDPAEAAQPLASYQTFNQFFYRKLKPGARPIASPELPGVLSSAADCRLTVFGTVDDAKRCWIKGTQFSLDALLGHSAGPGSGSSTLAQPQHTVAKQDEQQQGWQATAAGGCFQQGSVAVFRLAPQDYHRFHAPVAGRVASITDVPGQLFSVNPIAIGSPYANPLTANHRSVLLLDSPEFGPVAIVAVGATLVGSIAWTVEPGQQVQRGDELGYFAFGGSTLVALFQQGTVRWDVDLLHHSLQSIETKVRMGERLGMRAGPKRSVMAPSAQHEGLWA